MSRNEYRDGKLWTGFNYDEQQWYFEGKPDTRTLEELIEGEKEQEIYEILDKMIDELYTAGVDVSYFPEKAKDVLRKTAKKLNERT